VAASGSRTFFTFFFFSFFGLGASTAAAADAVEGPPLAVVVAMEAVPTLAPCTCDCACDGDGDGGRNDRGGGFTSAALPGDSVRFRAARSLPPPAPTGLSFFAGPASPSAGRGRRPSRSTLDDAPRGAAWCTTVLDSAPVRPAVDVAADTMPARALAISRRRRAHSISLVSS
jgi:hypothetical protein